MKTTVKLVLENTVARRNPIAAALCAGQFRKRVVRSKKAYTRKGRRGSSSEAH